MQGFGVWGFIGFIGLIGFIGFRVLGFRVYFNSGSKSPEALVGFRDSRGVQGLGCRVYAKYA